MLSVETAERLEKELNFMHQDLISKGFTEEEIKPAINENDKSDKKARPFHSRSKRGGKKGHEREISQIPEVPKRRC